MLVDRIPRVPDDWSAWAFSDSHGVTTGLVAALQEAGLIDERQAWVAPPQTALVGCGDYIDRGGDIRGMVSLMRRLQAEAATAGSLALFARGNHEAMPLMVRDGAHEWLDTWLEFGGEATLASFGCDTSGGVEATRVAATMETCAPGLFGWLDGLPQAVRWRDVLFVHGGLAPDHGLEDLGVTTDEHLWIRAGFFNTPWESGVFDAYQRAGIDRVVFGHTPQTDGPTSFHDGRSFDIDTNAVGNPDLPAGARQELTLLGLRGDGSFGDAHIITIPTTGFPDTYAAVR